MLIISELYLVLVSLSVIITGYCTVLAWSRHRSWSARALGLLMFLFTLTSALYLLEALSPTPQLAALIFKLRHPALSSLPIAMLIFTLNYTNRKKWLRPQFILPLWLLPLTTTIIFWFDIGQGWLYSSLMVEQIGAIITVSPRYGRLFPFWIIYMYGCALLSLILLTLQARRVTGAQRRHVGMVIAGVISALMLTVPYTVLQSLIMPDQVLLNLNPIGFAIGGAIFTVAVFRYNLLSMLPIANDKIVESISDVVIAVDLEMSVVQFNPAAEQFSGYKTIHALGKPLYSVFPYRFVIEPYLNGGERSGEVILGTKGQIFDLKVFPIYHTDHQLSGQVIILRDITQKKLSQQHMNDLAIEREKMDVLSHFVRDTSHELRTPLSVMSTCLYLLRKDIDADARTKQMNLLDDQMNKMSMLVDQLEQMVALDTELTLVAKPLSLNSVQQSVPSPFEAMRQKKDITLTWLLDEDLPPVRADKTLLRTAFQNILHNAIIYTPNGGSITVSTGTIGIESVYVEVIDTGIGISAAALPHIFDRFYKENKARTTNDSGLGLGLSLVHKIMDMHRGAVEVSSEIGRGSTFRLVFPLNRTSAYSSSANTRE
jgi:PAS domain S-box-containing protein